MSSSPDRPPKPMKPNKNSAANGEPVNGGTPLPATAAMQRRVNAQVRSYMSEIGAHGGATPSKAPRPRFTSESGREAVRRRWARAQASKPGQ